MKTSYPPCVDRPAAAGGLHALHGMAVLMACAALAGCGALPMLSRAPAPQAEGEMAPAQLTAGFEQAMAAAQQGDEAAAISELERLSQAYPQYSGPLLNLGILHLRAQRLDQARDALRGALARNPNNAAAHNQLGIVYRLQGEFEPAERAYLQALQIDPGYALAHLNLGVLYDLYLQRSQQALQAYRQYQALALQPRSEVAEWINELQRRVAAGPATP